MSVTGTRPGGKAAGHRADLAGLRDEDARVCYLRANSALPGPRANLELLHAFVETAPESLIRQLAGLDAASSAPNTPDEFPLVCGVAGLARLLTGEADGEGALCRLRELASDDRWRVREAVAIALQHLGRRDFDRLAAIAGDWAIGNPFEQRAAAAALAEPDLLREPAHTVVALTALQEITGRMAYTPAANRKTEGFRVLRQGLAYCWSVVVAADLERGRPSFEALLEIFDRDVQWVVRQNLSKRRLTSADPAWVARMQARVGGSRR